MILALALQLASASPPYSAAERDQWDRVAKTVTIHRDKFGVPHIYGPTDASVVFGLMYAQAEDNFWQLEEDYLEDLGRRAEVYGDTAVAGDVATRLFEVERKSRDRYAKATPAMRAIYDAFAAGVNEYLATHPEVTPRLLTHWEPWWALTVDLATVRIDSSTVLDGIRLRDWQRVETRQAPEPDEGSNMWAVAPSKTTTGRAMLFINPHVGFFGAGQRYELHIESAEGWRFSGFTILGTPIPRTGHNGRLGWSHTNNYADARDVYIERFDDVARPLAYRYGDEYRMATEWRDSVRVKTSGGIVTRYLTLRKTHHGPIVATRGGQALAVRLAREDGGALEQRYLMGKARTFAEWKRAMSRGTIVGSNTVYADVVGNIFYIHGNAIPKRAPTVDPAVALDGSDPRTEWAGYWSLDSLPQRLNPKSGYLINTNSTPWRMTGDGENPDSTRWPAYVAPEPYNARAQSSQRIMREHLRAGGKFSFEELSRAGFDRRVYVADSLIKTFLPQRTLFFSRRDSITVAAQPLVEVLQSWDRRSDTASVGMTIFFEWNQLLGRALRSMPNAIGRDGVADSVALRAALVALVDVRREFEADFGTWKVKWGDVNRLQRPGTSGHEPFDDAKPSLAVAGGPPALGIIFAFNAGSSGTKKIYGTSGNTYVSVVEFAPTLRQRSVVTFGQSGVASSPHFFDQAPLYARGQMKPMPWTKQAVIASASTSYHPGERK